MKKEYMVPLTHTINLEPQSILAGSPTLRYTDDKEASKDAEVLTKHKQDAWEHSWE